MSGKYNNVLINIIVIYVEIIKCVWLIECFNFEKGVFIIIILL